MQCPRVPYPWGRTRCAGATHLHHQRAPRRPARDACTRRAHATLAAFAARLRPSGVRTYRRLSSRSTRPARIIAASLRMTVPRGMPTYALNLYAPIGLPSRSPIATAASSNASGALDANRRCFSSAHDTARMVSIAWWSAVRFGICTTCTGFEAIPAKFSHVINFQRLTGNRSQSRASRAVQNGRLSLLRRIPL